MATALVTLGASLLSNYLAGRSTSKAAKTAAQADINAEHGVLQAGQDAQDVVSAAKGPALTYLGDAASSEFTNLDPYLKAGAQGAQSLADMAKKGFSFNYQEYANDPAFAFQMKEGTNAIQNSASARGLANSGNTLKALTTFGQGLASTYYQQAFDRAKSTFDTNFGAQKDLTAVGQRGTDQFQSAIENYGNKASGVELGTAADLAKIKMNTGSEAAKYAAAAGVPQAAGDLAVGKAQVGAVDSIGSWLSDFLKQKAKGNPGTGGYDYGGEYDFG